MSIVSVNKTTQKEIYFSVDGQVYGFAPKSNKFTPYQLEQELKAELKKWKKEGVDLKSAALGWAKRRGRQVSGPVMESILHEETPVVNPTYIHTIDIINRWWKGPLGQKVVEAILKASIEQEKERRELGKKELDALASKINGESLTVESVREGVRRKILSETTAQLVNSDNSLLKLYDDTMVCLNKNSLFNSVIGVDVERRLNYLYLWIFESADIADIVNFLHEIKSKYIASALLVQPDDGPKDSPRLYFFIISENTLPDFSGDHYLGDSEELAVINQMAATGGDKVADEDCFSGNIVVS